MSNERFFWNAIELLLAIESRRSEKELRREADEWVESVVSEGIRVGVVRRYRSVLLDEEVADAGAGNSFRDDSRVRRYIESLGIPQIECNFSHPKIRSKLEKLMGSDLVSLTDRNYMIFLQERILQDYANSVAKRILVRQAEEMERVKNLVLTGKIPLDQAPKEMNRHPVMLIDMYCRQELADRRAKIKVLKPFIPKHLYWDDTPDPPSGLSIESGHKFRSNTERLCIPPDIFLGDGEEILPEYAYGDEEFELLKYKSPLIQELEECESVEEMYKLADRIIGYMESLAAEEEEDEEGQRSTNAS